MQHTISEEETKELIDNNSKLFEELLVNAIDCLNDNNYIQKSPYHQVPKGYQSEPTNIRKSEVCSEILSAILGHCTEAGTTTEQQEKLDKILKIWNK